MKVIYETDAGTWRIVGEPRIYLSRYAAVIAAAATPGTGVRVGTPADEVPQAGYHPTGYPAGMIDTAPTAYEWHTAANAAQAALEDMQRMAAGAGADDTARTLAGMIVRVAEVQEEGVE